MKTETAIADTSIYHKNLQPVVYVLGDVSGRVESSVYAMLNLQPQIDKLIPPTGAKIQTFLTEQPPTTENYSIKWDGEWQVTYKVFRDLSIAFAIAFLELLAVLGITNYLENLGHIYQVSLAKVYRREWIGAIAMGCILKSVVFFEAKLV